jgi:hypothetical protein
MKLEVAADRNVSLEAMWCAYRCAFSKAQIACSYRGMGYANPYASRPPFFYPAIEVPAYERSLEAMWHAYRASEFATLNLIENDAGVVQALLHRRCWPTWYAGRNFEAMAALTAMGIAASANRADEGGQQLVGPTPRHAAPPKKIVIQRQVSGG